MLTQKEKILVKEYAKKLISKRKLNEAKDIEPTLAKYLSKIYKKYPNMKWLAEELPTNATIKDLEKTLRYGYGPVFDWVDSQFLR